MTLKAAQPDDLKTVISIFGRAVEDMCDHGIFQWDEIYPCEATLKEDIEKGDMLLLCSGERTVGTVVFNDEQDEAYAQGNWIYGGRAAVVHRLCIDPACQHQGYAKQAMQLAESALKDKGFQSVRLDAFSQNPYALRLYESLGYRRAGEVMFRKGLFYLFEKSLL